MHTPIDSKRGKLLSQYVCARVTSLDGIDLAHYDYDRHNSIYYFVLNAEEEIYLRYGGRDSASPATYLNLESLEIALEAGLSEHRKFLEKKRRPARERAKPYFPEDITLLNDLVLKSNRCAECHLVADYSIQEKSAAGLLDPIKDLYVAPDLKSLGLFLDVPKGLVLESVKGSAAVAGLQAGDEITRFGELKVFTFADFQYQLGKFPRHRTSLPLTVRRGDESLQKTLRLSKEWWKTDLSFRYWTEQPRVYFKAARLGTAERKKFKAPADGFAARVTAVDIEAVISKSHTLQVGDIITEVDGVSSDPLTEDLITHLTLHCAPNREVVLKVYRDGGFSVVTLKTGQNEFRKELPQEMPKQLVLPWSPETIVKSGDHVGATFRGVIANGFLLIQIRHQPGFSSKTHTTFAGEWKQSPLIESGRLAGLSYLAVPLPKDHQGGVKITLSTELFKDSVSQRKMNLGLEIPPSTQSAGKEHLWVRRLLESLVVVP